MQNALPQGFGFFHCLADALLYLIANGKAGFHSTNDGVLFGMGAETQFIDAVDHFTQTGSALHAVFQFAENLADLVFKGIGTPSTQLKLFEVWKQLVVYRLGEVVAGKGVVVHFDTLGGIISSEYSLISEDFD